MLANHNRFTVLPRGTLGNDRGSAVMGWYQVEAGGVCRRCATRLVRIRLKLAYFLPCVGLASVRAGCRQVIDLYGDCSREPRQAG